MLLSVSESVDLWSIYVSPSSLNDGRFVNNPIKCETVCQVQTYIVHVLGWGKSFKKIQKIF